VVFCIKNPLKSIRSCQGFRNAQTDLVMSEKYVQNVQSFCLIAVGNRIRSKFQVRM